MTSLLHLYKKIEKKNLLLVGYLLILLECLTPILAMLNQRQLIDAVFVNKDYGQFLPLLIGFAIFFFGPKLLFTLRKVTFYHLSYFAHKQMLDDYIRKVYSLPEKDISQEHIGRLTNTIRVDIKDTCNIGINKLLSDAIKTLVSAMMLAITIVYVNPMLLMMGALVSLGYYRIVKWSFSKSKELAKVVRKERSNLSVVMEENISSVKEGLALNAEKWCLQRYQKQFEDYFCAVKKEQTYKSLILLVSEPLVYGAKIFTILLGTFLVMNNQFTLGELVIAFSLVDQLVTAMNELFSNGLTSKRLDACIESISSMMNRESEPFGELDIVEKVNDITFKEVSFSYAEDNRVLDQVSLMIPGGSKVAIVGESGCGKSTIAKLLMREYQVSHGEVLVNGHLIENLSSAYKTRISMVYQDPYFLPISIEDNLKLHREVNDEMIERVCKGLKIDQFVGQFPEGYDTLLGERGCNLSGGERQRIAIARALLSESEILILDEATSALDTDTEYEVQTFIDNYRKNKTTVIIAHRLSTIKNADCIYFMVNGNVHASGTHDELMARCEDYKAMYQHT